MIEIYVEGEKLVLFADTQINIEYNNALFADETVSGDVAYTFQIPTKGNEKTLRFGHMPQYMGKDSRECEVYADTWPLVKGKLIIQSTKETTAEVAIICNPYPEEFAEKTLEENSCEETVISESLTGHKQKFIKFLEKCLNENSDIKFAPFVDEEAYGQDNEDFGFNAGYNKGKFVNRAVYDEEGKLTETQGNEISNEEIDLVEEDGLHIEKNRNTFAPQIRLAKIMQIIAENAGYKLIDHTDEKTKKIFVQAVKTLDADASQYSETVIDNVRISGRNATRLDLVDSNTYIWEQTTEYQWINGTKLVLTQPGRYQVNIEVKMSKSINYLGSEDFELILYKGDGPRGTDKKEILFRHTLGGVDPKDVEGTRTKTFHGRLYIGESFLNTEIKALVRNKNSRAINNIKSYATISWKGPMQGNLENSVNIHCKKFKITDLLPKTTNANFIKAIINDLALCYHIDWQSGKIEISDFKDILDAKAIDITGKTEKESTETNKRDCKAVCSMTPLQQYDTKNENLKGDTEDMTAEERDSYTNSVWWDKKANGYVKKEEVEDETTGWKNEWTLKGGTKDKTKTGEGEEKEIKSTVKIPANRTPIEHDTERGELNYNIWHDIFEVTPNIPLRLNSNMYKEKEENASDIILLYQRKKGTGDWAWIHGFQHDSMQAAGTGGYELTCGPGETHGETKLKKYMAVKHCNDTVKYKMQASLAEAMKIVKTLKPQEEEPKNQTRLLIEDGVLTIPQKISMQVENGKKGILLEIEAVKIHE